MNQISSPNNNNSNNSINTSTHDISNNSTKSLGSSGNGKTFPFPDCWHDDAEMEHMMCAFRGRQFDPHNYDAKMQFWMDMIADFCTFKGKAHFCHSELRKSFARSKTLPNCLGDVLEEMRRRKKIRLRSEYAYDPANSWRGWAVNCLVQRPLHWGVAKLKSSVGFGDPKAYDVLQYVHVEAMQKFCRELESFVLQPLQGKLVHYDVFRESVGKTSVDLTDECLHMCLHTLHCLGKIGLEYIKEDNELKIHLIKVPTKTDPTVAITDNDHAVHNLQMTRKNLLTQLEAIETDIHANEQKARAFLQEGKRLMAKSYLRRKRSLETKHEKLGLALHNIDELLSSVEEAKHSGDILNAYKIGSAALQNALKQSGLTYDSAHEVITDVRDTIEQHREVQDLIASTPSDTLDDEDAELERELRQLAVESPMKRPVEVAESPMKTPAMVAEKTTRTPVTKNVEISDADLLAMLDALEVEDGSPSKASTTSTKTSASSMVSE